MFHPFVHATSSTLSAVSLPMETQIEELFICVYNTKYNQIQLQNDVEVYLYLQMCVFSVQVGYFEDKGIRRPALVCIDPQTNII